MTPRVECNSKPFVEWLTYLSTLITKVMKEPKINGALTKCVISHLEIHLHLCIKIGGCNCAINMVLDKNHVLLFWSREVPKLVLNNKKKILNPDHYLHKF